MYRARPLDLALRQLGDVGGDPARLVSLWSRTNLNFRFVDYLNMLA
jgi:hypothetical protein